MKARFVDLSEKLGKAEMRGWLFTVVRNLVTDRARARAARPVEVAQRRRRSRRPSAITPSPLWTA